MNEAASAECPVSAITPELRTLVELEAQNWLTHQATGATLCGPNTAEWPAFWHDTVMTINIQRKLIERTEFEADK